MASKQVKEPVKSVSPDKGNAYHIDVNHMQVIEDGNKLQGSIGLSQNDMTSASKRDQNPNAASH